MTSSLLYVSPSASHCGPSSSSSNQRMSFFKRLRSHKNTNRQNSDLSMASSNSGRSPQDQASDIFSSMTKPSAAPRPPYPTDNGASNPFFTTTATRRPLVPPAANAAPAEAPPAYTPAAPAAAPGTDDPYAFLATFDTVFLVDDSGSMAGRSWRETGAALAAITPICTAHDADGVDLHFLNTPDRPQFAGVRRAETIAQLFGTVRPSGGTPTGTRLNHILRPYLRDLQARGADNVKPLNVIVVTDGVPSDDVESVVMAAAKKLEELEAPAWQVGVQFFQVGNEAGAREALAELDDGLLELGCPRDIVDTVPWNGRADEALSADKLLKVVLGSVNRRLDRKRNSTESARP